ncbi:MAG: citrate lyase subunit alpha, partial [Sarcina sp.]
MINKVGRDIPNKIVGIKYVKPFNGPFVLKPDSRRFGRKVTVGTNGHSKILKTIEEVIVKTGLKDGMTISFHHHFREGDFVLNMVMEVIAKLGIKDLTIA